MTEKITIDEIKVLIKEEGIKPSRLFGIETLAEDPIVKGIAKEEANNAVVGELTHRKRLGTRFEMNEEEWEKDKKKLEDENKALKIEGAKRDADSLFDSKMKERKLDKKQIDYIEDRKSEFIPNDPEKLTTEVDTYLDSKLEGYKKDAKIFGHETEKSSEQKGGSEIGSEDGKEGEENPFIP
jgi:hypothetical protein